MRPVTPRGFRDVLSLEAAERETMARAMSQALAAWGYGLVETPVAEEYATLEAGVGGLLEGTAFRLFDADSRLLALRPEMTVPIARLVAMRLCEEPGPYRLRYAAEVFRERASMRGQARQFTQVGLELIGLSGPAADAEVVAALVASLEAVGLREFTVGVGTVALLQAIIESAGMDAAWGDAVLSAAHERNLVGIEAYAAADGVPEHVARALKTVPGIRGAREAIEECRAVASACGGDAALDVLNEMWDLLEALGVAERVSIDFGVMRSFDYYTGMVLEVHAPGIGLPLGGGGRYDGVMGEFGSPAPAAGFAVGLERVHIALAEQDVEIAIPHLDAVLGGTTRDAFAAASRLRKAGQMIRLSTRSGQELVDEGRRAGACTALWAQNGRIMGLDESGVPTVALDESRLRPSLCGQTRKEDA